MHSGWKRVSLFDLLTSQQAPNIAAALPQATNTRQLLGRPPVVPVDWKSKKELKISSALTPENTDK